MDSNLADQSSSPHQSFQETICFGLDPATFKQREKSARERAQLLMERMRSEERMAKTKSFDLSLFPMQIPDAEWNRIRKGFLQRLKAFSCLVEDIYLNRNILKDGILPPEIVYEDPLFFPELQGIQGGERNQILFAALDLIRAPSGEWQVLENRFSTPTGIGRVLQIRRILSESVPEAFQGQSIAGVDSFPWRLYEHLSAIIDRTRDSGQIIILSGTLQGKELTEERLLAREMGIPLAHPRDLLVRNGQLYLRTIEGLEPVAVVYRRLEPPYLDPVGFASVNSIGVPGLLHCLRRQSVRIVNAPGCAVADNRALLRHSEQIIRYYCKESPILRTVPTYYGYDHDQAEWIADNRDVASLKTVCHPDILQLQSSSLEALLNKDPRRIVGQKLPPALPHPIDPERGTGHNTLRLFCLGGSHPYVLPGGRFRFIPDKRSGNGSFHPLIRDTWVNKNHSLPTPESLEPNLAGQPRPLPSSVAENMYWFGRYMERCQRVCDMLAIRNPWGEPSPSPGESLIDPLIDKGLLAALEVSHENGANFVQLTDFLHPGNHPNAPHASLKAAQFAMNNLHGYLDEDTDLRLANSLQRIDGSVQGEVDSGNLLKSVSADCDAIISHLHRSLLRDSGWQFFRLGQSIERGGLLATLTAAVLPEMVRRQDWHLHDESDLNQFLQLTGCLNLYHQIYHSRAYLDRVLQLVWKSSTCPMSLHFILNEMHQSLLTIGQAFVEQDSTAELRQNVASAIHWLMAVPIDSMLPSRARYSVQNEIPEIEGSVRELDSVCEQLMQFCKSVHTRLDNQFFCHQTNISSSFKNAFSG